MSLLADGLIVVAVLLNTWAFWQHERARRRLRQKQTDLHEDIGRLVGFVAFVGSEESGAPERVRKMARNALPAWVSVEEIIDVARKQMTGRVH